MSWQSTYATGTVATTNGDINVVGTGTGWVVAGLDTQSSLLIIGGALAVVDTIVDDTHLTLKQGWPGTTASAQDYILVQFPQDSVTNTKELRDFLAKLSTVGVIYYVAGAAPDPEVGDEGDFAVKIAVGGWTFWERQSGVWVLQGSPIAANTWEATIYDTDRPASGEVVLVWQAPRTTTFLTGLAASTAVALVAATADAFYSYRKNGVEFARCTFLAGQTAGVFSCASDTTFSRGDVLTVIAPASRDPTLSGITQTIVATL